MVTSPHRLEDAQKLKPLCDAEPLATVRIAELLFHIRPPGLEILVDHPDKPRGALVFDGGLWDLYTSDHACGIALLNGLPWDGRDFIFAGIAELFADHVRRNREVIWESPSYLYALRDHSHLRLDASERELGTLQPEHAEFVARVWPHGHGMDRVAYLRSRIVAGPTVAAFDGERVVAFALTHNDGALGILHTEPEVRGRGLGRAVIAALIRKLVEQGRPLFGHILRDNEVAQSLMESVGLERIFAGSWMGAR